MSELPEVLTVDEAAALLAVGPKALARACERGEVAGTLRIGTDLRIKAVAILRRPPVGIGQDAPRHGTSQTIAAVRAREVYESRRVAMAESKRRKRTGHTPQLVARLRAAQRGSCAICRVAFGATSRRLDSECADHCHASGEPRGLLCGACNMALGAYEKAQRPAGLRVEPYEAYLRATPVMLLEAT